MYYIIKGTIFSQTNRPKEAEALFNQALELDLPTDNERGMVLLQLASIHANKGNMAGAKNHFNQLKKLKITEPQIKEQVEFLEKALNQNMASRKAAQSMGKSGMKMMSHGGKRRRPKMR